jgi:hypothetical protein
LLDCILINKKGADINDKNTKGITPRIIEQVFTRINDAPSNIKFTVKVSYMEIYMERIRDLFNRNEQKEKKKKPLN